MRSSSSTDAGDAAAACSFYSMFDDAQQDRDAFVPKGVYSIEEMKMLGQQKGWCPYFTSRCERQHLVQNRFSV